MYFTLILENESGEQVNLSTTANQYMTSKIEGLNPPAGTVSTSSYAGMNGSYLNNAFIEKRNVVISFAMRGIGIEKRRHQLYRVVKPSRYIKIWYKTANIDVYAEGYVETCEVSAFRAADQRADLHSLSGYLLVQPGYFLCLLQRRDRSISLSLSGERCSVSFGCVFQQ